MRTICILLLAVGMAHADLPRPPGVPRTQQHYLPQVTPTITLLVGEVGPGGPPRLILPPSLFDAQVPIAVPPSGSPWIAGALLSLAAVLFGWRALGKKVPLPRLATVAVLILAVMFIFSGCLSTPEDQVIINTETSYAPLRCLSSEVTGELRIERGTEEGQAVLLIPVDEIKKLATP